MRSSQWESVPRSLLTVVAALLLLLAGAYYFIVPRAARFVAERIPESATAQISAHVLDSLDGSALRPTAQSPDRQQQITTAFERLWPPDRRGRFRLLFRSSSQLGANAMALPSGTIVVTDALVELARDDREILGVLAHEAGHVEARHGLRLVVQGGVMTIALGWIVGDFTSLIAVAPSALLHARYSRDFERDADARAADLLLSQGISPAYLADILQRIEASEGGRDGGTATGGGLLDHVATHPGTAERLEYLRKRR